MRRSSKSILAERRGNRDAEAAFQGRVAAVAAMGGLLVFFRSMTGTWWGGVLLLGIVAFSFGLLTIRDRIWYRRKQEGRTSESICQFARAFDRRGLDPVLVRATYEEIQWWLSEPNLPIRPDDRFDEDLRIDDEDLWELAFEIADLSGRSMEGIEENPLFGEVETPKNLIELFLLQPRSEADVA